MCDCAQLETTFEGLRASEDAVAKALNISEVGQIARAELRYRQYLLAQWNTLAAQATKRASAMARQEKSADAIARAVRKIMQRWADVVVPRAKSELDKIYRLARTAGWKKATGQTKASLTYDTPNLTELTVEKALPGFAVKPAFDVIDDEAIAALQGQQVLWIGQHYDTNLAAGIQTTARETMLEAGRNRAVAGRLMQERMAQQFAHVRTPGGFHGSTEQYFEGLAANAATVARAHGQLSSFMRVGATRFEIVNPRDRRTCPVCNHMDGKTFTVQQGADQMFAELKATDPDEIKKIHPWHSKKELDKISAKPGQLKGKAGAKDSADLANAGFSIPPFHFRCLLPGAAIQGRINGASRAQYYGKALELFTLKGRRLSVTPNHPILTSRGFVAAGQLREGDQLVCDRGQTRIGFLRSTTKGNKYEKPTRVEDVFRAFTEDSIPARITSPSDDFHGEAARFYGEVEVVGAYRELLVRWEAARLQQASKRIFEGASSQQALVHGTSALDFGLERYNLSSRCGPGSGTLPFDGFPTSFELRPFQELRLGAASQIDTALLQDSNDGCAGDTQLARQLLDRHSRQVSLDKVVDIREFDFCGHVFDLQSSLGWIVAQDIYISNCRCAVDIDSDEGVIALPQTPPTPKVPAAPKLPGVPTPSKADQVILNRLANGVIKSKTPIGEGVMGAEKAFMAHEGKTGNAVLKLAKDERVLRPGIPVGKAVNREAAAYQIDQALGGKTIVPPTVTRDLGKRAGGRASLQTFVEGALPTKDPTVQKLLFDMRTSGAITREASGRRMFLLDMISANDDRHSQNVMWNIVKGKSGKKTLRFIGIDNGLTFPGKEGPVRYIFPVPSITAKQAKTFLKLNAASQKQLANLTMENVASVLKGAGIEDDAIRASMIRVRAMQINPKVITEFDAGRNAGPGRKVLKFLESSHSRPAQLRPIGTGVAEWNAELKSINKIIAGGG